GRLLTARPADLVSPDGRVPAFHPAGRSRARTHSGPAVAAGHAAAASRTADQPRSPSFDTGSGTRTGPAVGNADRRSLLERDVDVRRARALAAHRLAPAIP